MTTRIITDSNGRKHITNEPLLHQPQPVQEPMCPECKADVLYECVACSKNNYPPQRTWVGLTDRERHDCTQSAFSDDNYRAIEAKLKEKNTT